MDKAKKKKLEAAGYSIGNAQDFLELTQAEMEYIEIKRALSKTLKEKRKANHLTQVEAAKRVHTSQSRFAKIESADQTVSIDLLLKANLALGATRKELRLAF
ncbi:MAG: helix-turn-helix transcriptional regulator [Kiritimatiellales bacterium]|nr:helix-turn-helix transcriptional regulator [Kiritimatiellales bacterium]